MNAFEIILQRVSVCAGLLCLTSVATMADTFVYDDSGRLTSAEQGNGLDHGYSLDAEASLLSASSGGADSGNGLAGWWENFFFGSTGASALASHVGDGISNLTKYILGMNPQVAAGGPLVTITQQSVSGQLYFHFTFTRSKAQASLAALEQSADSVNWFGGDAYFEQVGSATDLGDGTEQVTFRNLTPIPAANSLTFRLATNAGGGSSLVAYNNISSGTAAPSLPWWGWAVLLVALPLIAGCFGRGAGKRAVNAVVVVLMVGTLSQAPAETLRGWKLGTGFELPGDGLMPEVSAVPFPATSEATGEAASLLEAALTLQGSATDLTPELNELADALGNNPSSIFNYVRNKVEYQPYWGSFKGAHGTFVDGAGNDLDQCSLLIALLNAAGYTQTSYVRGTIQVPVSSGSLHDLVRWFGTSSSIAPVVIAASGIPFTAPLVIGGVAKFQHIWVRVVIGGVTYDFDPSYKRIQQYAGINFKTLSGYSRSQLLADAGGLEGTDFVQNLNRAGVESRLGQYAVTLRDYIRANVPGFTYEQIVGSGTLFEETVGSLAAGAPRSSFVPTELEVFTAIPASLRGIYRINSGPLDVSIPIDTLQALPLAITFDGDDAQLWHGGTLIAQETLVGGATALVDFSITHPVSRISSSQTGVPFLKTGTYDLSYGFYPNPRSRGRIEASNRRLANLQAAGMSDTSREVLTESLHGLGLRFIRRAALGIQISGKVANCYSWADCIFGRTGQESSFFVDMYGTVFLFNSLGAYIPAFAAQGYLNSAMEHGVIEERAPADALSTVKCLTLASDGGQKVYRVTPTNFSTISPQLASQGYSSQSLAGISNYVNSAGASGSTLVHEDPQTGTGDWLGYGYATISSSVNSMIISGGFKGGYYSLIATLLASESFPLRDLLVYEAIFGVERNLSAEPVDLATGAYILETTDLSLGEANTPRGLALSRSYESSRSFQPSALGNGWRHSCEGRVLMSSDPRNCLWL
jgi:hypothetical protein